MPIVFLKESNLFHIYSQHNSYILKIYKNAYPMHLYWGARLRTADISWNLEAPYRRKAQVEYADPATPLFSKEYWPFEYPSYGSSDFRPPAYQVETPDGRRLSDAVYTGFEILDGKPPLPSLPASYAQTPQEAQTLKLFLEDALLGLKITLFYTVFPDYDIITRHTEFTNLGPSTLLLRSALSFSLDLKQKPYELLQLCGTALREKHILRRKIENGDTSFSSTRGLSSHQETPFMALVEPHTTETSGEAYGLCLVYSGDFLARISCDMYDSARIQLGLNPFTFGWQLLPGESFCTPEVLTTFSSSGLNQMSQNFHKIFRERLSRGQYRDKIRPVLLNTWEASYFSFTQDSVLALAKAAAPLGIEMLVLDDGWFGHRNDASSSLGDWTVNPEKLPQGLSGLAERVNALGMKLGLWFEPEGISPDSELYRAHPDWCIHLDGRPQTLWRNQLVLDLSRPEVCEATIEALSKILSSANIEYVKWDNNRRITEPGSLWLSPAQQSEFSHRYILGLYHILESLTARFPQILFENCASGGARFDPGMMYYFSQTWASDNTDAACRLKIQYGTSLAYPPLWITSHVSASPNHQTLREMSLPFREHSASPFNLGYELDLCKMSPAELDEVKAQISRYKSIRPLVQFGDFFRLKSPFQGNETAWMTLSPDKSSCLVWYYKTIAEQEEGYLCLKLVGLDPESDYLCAQDGRIYGGDVLMQLGLTIPWENGDYFSYFWQFQRQPSREGGE